MRRSTPSLLVGRRLDQEVRQAEIGQADGRVLETVLVDGLSCLMMQAGIKLGGRCLLCNSGGRVRYDTLLVRLLVRYEGGCSSGLLTSKSPQCREQKSQRVRIMCDVIVVRKAEQWKVVVGRSRGNRMLLTPTTPPSLRRRTHRTIGQGPGRDARQAPGPSQVRCCLNALNGTNALGCWPMCPMDQGAKRKGGAAVGSSGQSESSWAVPRELGRHDGPIGDTGCTKMALGPEKDTYTR